MRTAQLGNVAVQDSGYKRSKFPMSKNVYGSCSFGEVNCCSCLQTEADSKTSIDTESLTYLAALVAPTYGHVNLNFWHYFVELGDISEIWESLFAQTEVSCADGSLAHLRNFPSIPHNLLSTLFLWGAHCTVYGVEHHIDGTVKISTPRFDIMNESSQAYQDAEDYYNQFKGQTTSWLRTSLSSTTRDSIASWCPWDSNSQSLAIDARVLLGTDGFAQGSPAWLDSPIYVPLSVPSWEYLFDPQLRGAPASLQTPVDTQVVTIDGSDFILEREFYVNGQAHRYLFAFRMHGIGYRIYKLLKGMNFHENWNDFSPASLVPLFAVFHAYFSCFGLLLYSNIEATPFKRLMRVFDAHGGQCNDFTYGMITAPFAYESHPEYAQIQHLFQRFILDFGCMWVTDSQDYVSAHTISPTVSPSVDQSFINDYYDVKSNSLDIGNSPAITVPTSEGTSETTQGNKHAYINDIIHGHLDSELLKKLYLITNRNTIAGKRVEEILRQQGFGKWIDHCKPRFIGFDSVPIEFSQVISQSDTLQKVDGETTGAILGERGGNGQAYGHGKAHFYHNDRIGFMITLFAVVPDAGYCQQENVAFGCLKKTDFYMPDFDGVGMEASKIKRVCAEVPNALLHGNVGDPTPQEDIVNKTFGFLPMMSRFKVNGNTISGHFARRSQRRSYLPYTMDKFISLGDVQSEGIYLSDTSREEYFAEVFPVEEFPRAGLLWRYPTRYPFLGHFDRIFASLGEKTDVVDDNPYQSWGRIAKLWEFVNNQSDGFSLMSTVKITQMKRMLPISDSFETREDGNEGAISTNVGKA